MAGQPRRNRVSALKYYTFDGTRMEINGGTLADGARMLFLSMAPQHRDLFLNAMSELNAELKARAAAAADARFEAQGGNGP